MGLFGDMMKKAQDVTNEFTQQAKKDTNSTENGTVEDIPESEYADLEYSNWEQEDTNASILKLRGREIQVSPEKALYNSYRKMFVLAAKNQVGKVTIKYNNYIKDYQSFSKLFVERIYLPYMQPMFNKANDICLAKGIYSENAKSLSDKYFSTFKPLIPEMAKMMAGNIASTNDALKESLSGTWNFMRPNTSTVFASDRKSLQSAARSAAIGNIANNLIGGVVTSALVNSQSAKINNEMFSKINPNEMLNCVYMDYANIHLLLIDILKKNGVLKYEPIKLDDDTVKRTLENIENPSVSEDNALNVYIDFIQKNPYDNMIYDSIDSRFGNMEETDSLRAYFGII